MDKLSIIEIDDVLLRFAQEKARLMRQGQIIEDFDTLIAATALHHDLIPVTDNFRHFNRFPSLRIKDWSKPV